VELKIEIKMDNAAFEPANGTEAARILRRIASAIDGMDLNQNVRQVLRDINGNVVGKVTVTE
jgi:hypothetical protein